MCCILDDLQIRVQFEAVLQGTYLLQTYLQLFILTILLINGPRNAHQIYIYIYIYIVYIQYDRGCKDYKIETESEYTILYNLL